MLSLEGLADLVRRGEIDTVLLAFTDLYGRFMGKRLDAEFFLEEAVADGTHACDYLLTVDMEMETVPGYAFASWERGYGDVHLVPDLDTLRVASWLDRTAMVLCNVRDRESGSAVEVAPRSMLERQVRRAAEMGYTAFAGSELEYYIFCDSYRDAAGKGYAGLESAGWYVEDYHVLQGTRVEAFNGAARRHLRDSGVPVENSKGEAGIGQHELNVRYTDVLAMADRHAVFKQCLKEVAEQLGMSVTFMAKFDQDRAGSSCHIHLSLQRDGRAAFPGGPGRDGVPGSDVFRWFLGGWIAHTPEMMVLYAPTVNSYKRYRPGSWAPTGLAWGVDNRSAGFRVVGTGDALRIECRIPGADCNPYLVYAAALASGLDGIANRMEPPPFLKGNAYSVEDGPNDAALLPATFRDATDLFEASAFACTALGTDVVEHYVRFFRVEEEAFENAVTDWERRRYFERI